MKKIILKILLMFLFLPLITNANISLEPSDLNRYVGQGYILSDAYPSNEVCIETRDKYNTTFGNYTRSECFTSGNRHYYFICNSGNCNISSSANGDTGSSNISRELSGALGIEYKEEEIPNLDRLLRFLSIVRSQEQNLGTRYESFLNEILKKLNELGDNFKNNRDIQIMVDYLTRGVTEIKNDYLATSDIERFFCELTGNCGENKKSVEEALNDTKNNVSSDLESNDNSEEKSSSESQDKDSNNQKDKDGKDSDDNSSANTNSSKPLLEVVNLPTGGVSVKYDVKGNNCVLNVQDSSSMRKDFSTRRLDENGIWVSGKLVGAKTQGVGSYDFSRVSGVVVAELFCGDIIHIPPFLTTSKDILEKHVTPTVRAIGNYDKKIAEWYLELSGGKNSFDVSGMEYWMDRVEKDGHEETYRHFYYAACNDDTFPAGKNYNPYPNIYRYANGCTIEKISNTSGTSNVSGGNTSGASSASGGNTSGASNSSGSNNNNSNLSKPSLEIVNLSTGGVSVKYDLKGNNCVLNVADKNSIRDGFNTRRILPDNTISVSGRLIGGGVDGVGSYDFSRVRGVVVAELFCGDTIPLPPSTSPRSTLEKHVTPTVRAIGNYDKKIAEWYLELSGGKNSFDVSGMEYWMDRVEKDGHEETYRHFYYAACNDDTFPAGKNYNPYPNIYRYANGCTIEKISNTSGTSNVSGNNNTGTSSHPRFCSTELIRAHGVNNAYVPPRPNGNGLPIGSRAGLTSIFINNIIPNGRVSYQSDFSCGRDGEWTMVGSSRISDVRCDSGYERNGDRCVQIRSNTSTNTSPNTCSSTNIDGYNLLARENGSTLVRTKVVNGNTYQRTFTCNGGTWNTRGGINVVSSTSTLGQEVISIYREVLGRFPDQGGFYHWTNRFQSRVESRFERAKHISWTAKQSTGTDAVPAQRWWDANVR